MVYAKRDFRKIATGDPSSSTKLKIITKLGGLRNVEEKGWGDNAVIFILYFSGQGGNTHLLTY